MIKLRDYQQGAVVGVKKAFIDKKKHLLVQAPTGAGKTIIFSYISQNTSIKGNKVLILTNRTELLTQADGSLSKFGLNNYLIRAGVTHLNKNSDVYIAMTQTLRNRIKKKYWRDFIQNEISLVIIDEAHLQDFNYLFEDGILNNKPVLGFTATPKRTGKMRQLGLDYEDIISTISVSELVKRGFLVPDDYHGVSGVNMNNVGFDSMKGDYKEGEMFQQFNTPKLYSGVVKNYKEICPNTKTIVFCVNIEHCIHTCEEFNKNGIKTKFLVSGMSKPKELKDDATEGQKVRYNEKLRLYNLYKEKFGWWSGPRQDILKQFKEGKFQVLINAGILTTGFDEPSIETVIVNRATLSLTLWLQMIGRGSRLSQGKTHFNILDFGGNAERLGHYMQPQNFGLWHESGKEGGGVAPVKVCGDNSVVDKNGNKGCQRLIPASATICPICGHMYPKKKAKEVNLQGIVYDTNLHKAIKTKKISKMTTKELIEYHKMKGHNPVWLWRQLYFRGGKELIEKVGLEQGWKDATITRAKNFF